MEFPEDVVVDKDIKEKFIATVKELGLSSEQAQKIVDLQVELAKKSSAQFDADQLKWRQECKDDTDFGGDKFDESLVLAKKAMDKFGSPELKGLLEATGFGDHPQVFKLMTNIGRAMGEADFLEGRTNLSNDDRETADVLFDDMKIEGRN